jgi:hypothetical protein
MKNDNDIKMTEKCCDCGKKQDAGDMIACPGSADVYFVCKPCFEAPVGP